MSLATALGDCINREYQAGSDAPTLRLVALAQRECLPEDERAAFTEAIEMSGLLLDEVPASPLTGRCWHERM